MLRLINNILGNGWEFGQQLQRAPSRDRGSKAIVENDTQDQETVPKHSVG